MKIRVIKDYSRSLFPYIVQIRKFWVWLEHESYDSEKEAICAAKQWLKRKHTSGYQIIWESDSEIGTQVIGE